MDEQLLQYFSGELTADKRSELIRRTENDSHLRAEFIRLQNLNAVSQLSLHSSDKDEGVKHYETFTSRKQIRLTVKVAKYAAMVLLLIASAVWSTLFLSERNKLSSLNTLYVPAGQRARVTLQDGTEVWLNAQSTLKYPSHFSKKNRKVEITGEAFFNVAQDKKRPFIVNTQHIDMEVLGTQFNVYSYPDACYTQASLVEGSLRVSEKQNKENTIILAPNEQITFREGQISVERIPNPDYLLWKDGIYSFNNERLIDIIEKLQLYYDIKIVVEDPEIFNVRYTGKFRQRDGIDEILSLIQKIQPFKINRDRENNLVTLTK